MGTNNSVLGVIASVFIILLVIATRMELEEEDFMTGAPTTQTATVLVRLLGGNVTAQPSPQLGAGQIDGASPPLARVGIRVTPSNFLRAFSLSFETGAIGQRQFYIKNTGDITLELLISSTLAVVQLDKERVRLTPHEEAVVNYRVLTDRPGIHAGKITVQNDLIKEEIPVVIAIRSEEILFNLNLDVTDPNVSPGDDLNFHISIVRASGDSVELEYMLKDAGDRTLVKKTETRPIQTSLNFADSINVPKTIRPGTYLFAVEAHYKGKTDVASQVIHVSKAGRLRAEEPKKLAQGSINLLAPLIILFLIILLNIVILRRKKPRL